MVETASYGDRVLARRLFDFLEDRRVLYVPYFLELPGTVIKSIFEIREQLTSILMENETGEVLAVSIRNMRGASRRFLQNSPEYLGPERNLQEYLDPETQILTTSSLVRDPFVLSRFSADLGEFRARLGEEVARLSEHFQLEVPGDLRLVLPPPPE